MRRYLPVLVFLALVLGSIGPGPEAAEKVKLSFGYTAFWGNFQYYYALQEGIVKAEGVDVDIKAMFPAELDKLLLTGSIDGGSMTIGSYLIARERGLPVKAIATTSKDGTGSNVVIALKKSGLSSPKDLEGKQLGTLETVNMSTVVLKAVLRDLYKVDLSKVTLVVKDPPVLATLLSEGKIDAALLFSQFGARFGHPSVGPPSPKYADYIQMMNVSQDWAKMTGGPAPNWGVMVFQEKILKERRQAVINLVKALRQSAAYYAGHEDEVLDAFMKKYGRGGGDRELLQAIRHVALNTFTLMEAERRNIHRQMEYAKDQGLIKRSFTIDELFDPIAGEK